MIVKLKQAIKSDKKVFEKGTQGKAIGVSNSKDFKKHWPDLSKGDDWLYLVRFLEFECLLSKEQLEF